MSDDASKFDPFAVGPGWSAPFVNGGRPDWEKQAPKHIRVISLGAGVQSTALVLLAIEGKIKADAAVFADTQSEPQEVYDHLTKLRKHAMSAGFPIHLATGGSLEEAVLNPPGKYQPSIPAWVDKGDGKRGKLQRHCTRDFKIMVVRRELRAILNAGAKGRIKGGHRVTSLIGISTDEIERMHTNSDVKWIDLEYPLIDLNMSRDDCIEYLAEKGWTAPKSSCVFCPFHGDAYWRHIKSMPAEWGRAVKFDRQIRNNTLRGVELPAYLHSSCKPLDEADLGDAGDTFGEDCSGTCGVWL